MPWRHPDFPINLASVPNEIICSCCHQRSGAHTGFYNMVCPVRERIERDRHQARVDLLDLDKQSETLSKVLCGYDKIIQATTNAVKKRQLEGQRLYLDGLHQLVVTMGDALTEFGEIVIKKGEENAP